jgi:hypothetical protein
MSKKTAQAETPADGKPRDPTAKTTKQAAIIAFALPEPAYGRAHSGRLRQAYDKRHHSAPEEEPT